MKLLEARTDVFIKNPVATHQCTIATGPKMFDMLIRQYTNPIYAFLRELGCNAADSHLDVGKADVPFEVTFVSPGSSHLQDQALIQVRDFGTGMSHEKVLKLYTNVGESDKTESDKPTGCLGIGSKSPLAYAQQFFVECFDGVSVRMYCVTRDENGYLLVLEQGEFESDEETGVRVTVPVRSEDVPTVAKAAFAVFRNFGHPHSAYNCNPDLIGFEDYAADDPGPVVDRIHRINDVAYWRKGDRYSKGGDFVLMGNIKYPFNASELMKDADVPASLSEVVNHFIRDNDMVFCVPLGDESGNPYLTFPPSRDAIEMTPKGREFLQSHLQDAVIQWRDKIAQDVDAQENLVSCAIWVADSRQKYNRDLIYRNFPYKGEKIPRSVNGVLTELRATHCIDIECWEPKDKTEYFTYRSKSNRQTAESSSLRLLRRDNAVALVDQLASYRKRVEEHAIPAPYLMVRVDDRPIEEIETILDKMGLSHFRVSSLPKYSPPKRAREKRDASLIYMRLKHLRYGGVTDRAVPEAKPEDPALVVRMQGWDCQVGGRHVGSNDYLRMVKLVESNLSPFRCAHGLRRTNWPDKRPPEGAVWFEDFLKQEVEKYRKLIPHLSFASAIESMLGRQKTLGDFIQRSKEFQLRATTDAVCQRVQAWVVLHRKTGLLQQYTDLLNELVVSFGEQLGIKNMRPGKTREAHFRAASKIVTLLSNRFSLVDNLHYSALQSEELCHHIGSYVKAVDQAQPVGDLKLSLFPRFGKVELPQELGDLAKYFELPDLRKDGTETEEEENEEEQN